MRLLTRYALSLCPALLAATPLAAQRDTAAVSVAVHGFISISLFWQDRAFGPDNGQEALWVQDTVDQAIYGGDSSARARATRWQVFVVGHYDYTDLDDLPEPPDSSLTGWAVEGGAKLEAGALTLRGTGYRGHSIAQQFAQLLDFGDISGWGAWVQAGWRFTGNLSVWTFYGLSRQSAETAGARAALERPKNWS